MAPKNNPRFARIVADTFNALGVTQDFFHDELGGPSDSTLRKITDGKLVGVSVQTLNGFDTAFGWTSGSAAQTLAGGDPTLITDDSSRKGSSTWDDRVDALNVGDGSTAGIVDHAQRAWSRLIELTDSRGDMAATARAVLGSSDFYIDALLTMQAGPTAKPLLGDIFSKLDEVVHWMDERKEQRDDLEVAAQSAASAEGGEGEEASMDDAERRAVDEGIAAHFDSDVMGVKKTDDRDQKRN